MMEVEASVLAWLVAVPVLGILAVAPLARVLRRRWLPDADAVICATLAAVLIMSAFLTSFHLVAFGRMCGWLSGLPIPVISLGFSGLLAVWGIVLIRYGSPVPVGAEGVPCQGGRIRFDWFLLVPVAVAHSLLLVEGLSRMPVGSDALKYHLPMVVTWMRADALVMRPEHWRLWMLSLPGNGELVTWWLLKAGAERIASVAYWPGGVVLAGAAWSMVRIQRGSRFAGLVAVALVLSTQMVVWQMYKSYVDLFGTAFLAGGVTAFLLAASKKRTRSARRLLVVIAGLGIGISLGTKPINWAYGLAVAVLFLIVHLYRNRRDRDLLFLAVVFTVGCAACSAFWFVRATLETGNPFYPMHVAIGDHTFWKGVTVAETTASPVLPLLGSLEGVVELLGRLPRHVATLDARSGGVGPLFSMFVPLGMAVAAGGILLRGRRACRHDRLVVLLVTGVLFVIWVLAIRHYARFGMIYLVMASCAAAPVVGWVARFWPRPVYGAALLATCVACATAVVKPAQKMYARLASGDLSRAAHYGIPEVIDDFPAGTRIANLTSPKVGGRGLTYPLYGEGLKNDVIDFMTIKALFPDLRPSVEELQGLGVEYVFFREPFPDDWRAGDRLELVYDDALDPRRPAHRPASRIYRVPAPTRVSAASRMRSGQTHTFAGPRGL